MTRSARLVLLSALPLLALTGCLTTEFEGGGANRCTVASADALRVCVADHGTATAECYASGDAACADADANQAAALDTLQTAIESECADGDFGGLDVSALVGRLQNACASESDSIAWRTYGGPQGAVYPAADADGKTCLATAHEAAREMVDGALTAIDGCLAGASCDAEAVETTRAELEAVALGRIEGACDDLSALVTVDPALYVERAAHQVDCLAAIAHPVTKPLDLDCGPGNVQFEAERGEWTQVVVDGEEWGTLCGDGTDYAFYIRLAPEGEPLDRVLIGLQGGGVCLFGDDCGSRLESDPGLFNAMDDMPIGSGIASTEAEESPFANYTQVYLPYCNQDVFAGGGVVEDLGNLELPRYGAINARAAVQMSRDMIWKLMDEEGGAGYRPDEVVALFGGWSAGGYGTLYNYHWFLDDLQWPRTIAFPDAGLALDNGTSLGVAGLGQIKIPIWGTLPNLPPYCFEGDCAVGPVLYEAISPRLRQVPQQQMLILTNPYDLIQQGDAFFSDTPSFINEMRSSYCDTKDLDGIQYYFTSVSDESLHVVTLRPELWSGSVVDGQTMRDWFQQAVEDPDGLTDRVEEGDFVQAFDGVEPYPCAVAP